MPSSSRPGLHALLIGAIVVLIVGISRGERAVEDYLSLRDTRDALLQTVEGIEASNENLRQEVTRLRRSPAFARRVLRDKYHITDADESIIFFAD